MRCLPRDTRPLDRPTFPNRRHYGDSGTPESTTPHVTPFGRTAAREPLEECSFHPDSVNESARRDSEPRPGPRLLAGSRHTYGRVSDRRSTVVGGRRRIADGVPLGNPSMVDSHVPSTHDVSVFGLTQNRVSSAGMPSWFLPFGPIGEEETERPPVRTARIGGLPALIKTLRE